MKNISHSSLWLSPKAWKTDNVGVENSEQIRQANQLPAQIVIFVALLIASSFASDVFFSQRNIFNLLRQVAGIGAVSMGMLLVILTAGIDLSVGSISAIASVLVAYFLTEDSIMPMPLSASIVCTIMVGVLLGSLSGFLVANRRVAPFVATLALMTIARGLAFIVSKGRPILLTESGRPLKNFGSDYWL